MSERTAKTRRRATPAAPAPLPGEPNVHAAETAWLGGFGFGSGFDAADESRSRGYVYYPEMDARKELTEYTRGEIDRRVRYLDANVGFAGRILTGLARMVAGTGLMVRPTTGSREWNRLRAARFEERNSSAASFDLARRWDFYSSQFGVMRSRYKSGDMGAAFTLSEAGQARMAFYEANRICNGRPTSEEVKNLFDGVLVDRHNAAIAYRVTGDHDSQADIPAESFCLIGDSSTHARHRSPSILHRAVTHLLDRTEINSSFKRLIKSSSRIGYYIGKETGSPNRPPGLSTGVGLRERQTLTNGKKIDLEKVLEQGGEMPELDPGHSIKLLLDERPHPNTLGFLEYLHRDVCWGVDVAPELLWNIAALGSANTRYVMADSQSFIELQQQTLIDSYLARYYFFDTQREIATGRLPPCPDPMWWKHAWIPPTRWTIDKGKDGKLHLEQVRSGALTFRRMLGWEGLESELELTEWLDEMKFIGDEAKTRGLDPERTLDRIYGRPGTAAPASAAEPADPADAPKPAPAPAE